jgi:hypothetical protein
MRAPVRLFLRKDRDSARIYSIVRCFQFRRRAFFYARRNNREVLNHEGFLAREGRARFVGQPLVLAEFFDFGCERSFGR